MVFAPKNELVSTITFLLFVLQKVRVDTLRCRSILTADIVRGDDMVTQRNHKQCPGGQSLLAIDDLVLRKSRARVTTWRVNKRAEKVRLIRRRFSNSNHIFP